MQRAEIENSRVTEKNKGQVGIMMNGRVNIESLMMKESLRGGQC